MAEYYTDKKLPGVGISIGLTRLFYKLNELQAIKEEQKSVAKVLVISMIEDKTKALEISNTLVKSGICAEVYLEDKKIKAQFKYADRLEIPYVIVIGEDEITNNTITLKNMKEGNQETTTLEKAIEILR